MRLYMAACLIKSSCLTPGTVLDSGAQVNILEGTLGSGTRFQLTGITGATTEAERADAMFPVHAADGSRHAISIRGKNIVATRTTDNILSLAVLLKEGYKVEFRVGTDLDPIDGGDLYTPKGKRIALVFSGHLWRLPMWSSPSRCASTAVIPAHQNPFAALLNIPENVACTRAASQPSEVSPLELSVADQTRLCHDRDGHPSYNTHLRMYKSREGRGYPANFPSLLAHFKCETCAVTLGARTYRTSKRVQDKGYHTKRQQESEVTLISTITCSPLKCPCCAPSEAGLPDISRQATCLARASQPKKKSRKSKKAKGTVIAAPAEASAPPLVAVVAPRLVHPPQHRMHIDYAHSITLGRNKKLYYLIIVIDIIDFTWAQPSPNRSEPEDLIRDLMTLTGIKVGHICADGAGEFKRFKHGREVPPAAQLQYLKPQLIAQALAHHKFVFTLPKSVRNDSQDLQVMVTKANSIKGTWYVECDIVSPKELLESMPIQLPVVRGKNPTTNHKDNVQDLFSYPESPQPGDSGRHWHFRRTKRACYASITSSRRCGPQESVIPARLVNPYTIYSLRTFHDFESQTPEGIKLHQQGKSNKL
jgi:hypothetical protein